MESRARADTVIIVDDDPIARQVLRAMLHAAGTAACAVLEAEGARAALQILERHPRAFVLCDLAMPDMDGVEFVRALAHRAPSATLFFVSAADPKVLAIAVSLARGAGLRVVGASTKPLAPERLRDALQAAQVALASMGAAAVSDEPTAEELRHALPTPQFEIVFLPIVRLADATVMGVEALARWRHPRLGLLGPDRFIPLAERSGQIWPLTLQVARRALAQVSAWRHTGLPLAVSINVSALGEGGLDFPDRLLSMVRQAQIDPSIVTLELTETGVTTRDVDDVIARLWLKGFALAIDDFGVGNAGFEQLRRLPFTQFKIDRSLVRGVDTDREQRALLETSVALGRRLGLTVVAEGVERREEWDVLRGLNCEGAQGFLITRPLPASAVPAWFERWSQQPPVSLQTTSAPVPRHGARDATR